MKNLFERESYKYSTNCYKYKTVPRQVECLFLLQFKTITHIS